MATGNWFNIKNTRGTKPSGFETLLILHNTILETLLNILSSSLTFVIPQILLQQVEKIGLFTWLPETKLLNTLSSGTFLISYKTVRERKS